LDFSNVAVLVLIGLVLLRGILIGVGAALILRAVTDCPACFSPTYLLQRKWLRRFLPWLEWRFCPHCGWQGPSKRQLVRPAQPVRPPARPAAHPYEEPGGPRW
jgi:hypothetical protein